ncbi:hypothetical protein [Dryocola sp. BD626]|uniref:hypothetical protein n=1 Tax=Dryocola sp. BD626 TaxID=3133273 RepID=UPI003F4F4C8D
MSSDNTVTKLRPNQDVSRLDRQEFDYNAYSKHGGGNGGGENMLERVKKLEDQMASLVTDVAIIKSNYATKADLHEELGKQTKWIAVTIIGTVSVAMAVAKLLF